MIMNRQKLYDATYRLLDPAPATLWVGEALLLRVELINLGLVPWLTFGAHPVRLSYHWRATDGSVIVADGRRTLLPVSVPPASRITVELRAEAPPEPGDYELVIDLVEEGFGWFAERGVSPLVVNLSYRVNTAPKACIINGNCVINDAVGNHVVAQLRALQQAGYHTLLLVEHVDERLPVDVRRSAVALHLTDLHHPDPNVRHAVDHFYAADVVIVNYSTYYQLVEAIKLVRHSAIIFDYHGVTPPEHWDRNAPGYMDLVLGQQYLHLVQYADYGVGHSQFTCGELIQTGLIPASRVRELPYAVVDQVAYRTHRDPELVAQYGLEGQHVLLYVGRMARNKRIIDLVEALALVLRRYPETVLLLVGQNQFGPYRDYVTEVQQRAIELGCQDRVIFTGQVPDLEPYYQLCDVLVTASVHEGFCMPVVEAMAHGKPVVAANTTALPGTLGRAGLMFEPQNPADLACKIEQLLDSLPVYAQPDTPVDSPATTLTADTFMALRTGVIAFVTPRYGLEIVGGAERLIRGWAEYLASQGYQIEVLTTCTADMGDWANAYLPGVAEINGVIVRRFATDQVDAGVFHRIQNRAIAGAYISYDEELEFMRHNLQSSALNAYLHDHAERFMAVIFAPYLFGTTYFGMQVVPEKALIVPCLHDEPVARFDVMREMLEGAAGILFNTQAECDFATDTLHIANPARTVVGYGFDVNAPPGDGAGFRQRYQLPERCILYSGRLEEGKNVPLLWDYFLRYKSERPGDLALVLTGAQSIPVPKHPDIIALNILPEADMPHAFAAATLLCQPSLNESFSIVLMEAWLQGRPVLVHADCAVTRDHVEQSGGGLLFRDYSSFRSALDRLLNDPVHAAELGQRGRAYVQQHYAWDVVSKRILQAIVAFTQERSVYDRLAQRGIQRALTFTPKRFYDAQVRIVEQARATTGRAMIVPQQHKLQQEAQVAMPEYRIQSRLPVVGRMIAWTRKQLTSHLKEPYLDLIIGRQQRFNQQLLATLLPMLEQSLDEQRRLRREVEVLREQLVREVGMIQDRLDYGSEEENKIFLHTAFDVLSQRVPDVTGHKHYLQALQSKQLTRQHILKLISASAESQQEFYTLPMQPPDALHQARLLLVQQCLPPAQVIVDLGGAAFGHPSGALLAMGYPHRPRQLLIVDLPPDERIWGIGIRGVDDTEQLQEVVTHDGVQVRYLYRSMTDLGDIAANSVDLVFSGESIEHISEADGDIVCREVYRILKPGGYFCLDTPNAALTRLQSPHELIHPEHKKEYYVHELRTKLERWGFQIVEAKGICPMPESLRSKTFDYRELVQNIALCDNAEEGYLFFLKGMKL